MPATAGGRYLCISSETHQRLTESRDVRCPPKRRKGGSAVARGSKYVTDLKGWELLRSGDLEDDLVEQLLTELPPDMDRDLKEMRIPVKLTGHSAGT